VPNPTHFGTKVPSSGSFSVTKFRRYTAYAGYPETGYNARFSWLDHIHVKVEVKFTLEQATKAQRERADVKLYSSFNLCTRWGWVVNATPGRFIPGKDPVPIV
jgi:hypothetical protein